MTIRFSEVQKKIFTTNGVGTYIPVTRREAPCLKNCEPGSISFKRTGTPGLIVDAAIIRNFQKSRNRKYTPDN